MKTKIRRRCKCGCGKITKPGNEYINGHHLFGNTHKKGWKTSKKTRKKLSISMMGNINGEGNEGKKHSVERRLKNSLSHIKYDPNYEYDGSWQDREYKKDLRKDYCENKNCKGSYEQLDNHHIDLNKKNGRPSNIMTLCNSCHASLHNNLQDGKHIIVNPKDFLIINRPDHISYINKKTRKKIIVIKK